MDFFNNKINEKLKFKINSEGINIDNIEPRLIFKTNENKNYLFFGNVKNDICEFDIPELKIYESGDNGKIKFEIISDDLYFPVWEDTFEIRTKATVKMEEMVIQEQIKPKITASSLIVEKIEKTKEKIEEQKENDDSKKKEIVDKELTDDEEQIEENEDTDKEELQEEKLKTFNDFFKE